MNQDILKGKRARLVEVLRQKGIINSDVLRAIGNVPRHSFFDPGILQFAYHDNAYPIGSGQTISQPFTVAYQTELLCIQKGSKVLEVGTGSGYQSAILAEIGVELYSIERIAALHYRAKYVLDQLKYPVFTLLGDGYQGHSKEAPFEAIIVTAGAPEIPSQLLLQLAIGGHLVIPLGGENKQIMTRITRLSQTDFRTEQFGNFAFVPMLRGVK